MQACQDLWRVHRRTAAIAEGRPMTSADLLIDAFSRVHDAVHQAVMGLTPQQLAFQPYPEGNSIAWLVWHLSRIQDDHVAGVTGAKQVWESGDWAPRFGLPSGSMEHGYGYTPVQVAAITVDSAEVLTANYAAIHEITTLYLHNAIQCSCR